MGRAITEDEAVKISLQLKKQGKKIVLTGGCFDILHLGHIRLLREAGELGDYLFVLLESDNAIKNIKGHKRPINTQKERAEILESLEPVDYVVLLKGEKNNKDYDKLIVLLSPDVIATTSGDKNIHHKKRQADLVGAKLIEVIKELKNRSTSRIAKFIAEENI